MKGQGTFWVGDHYARPFRFKPPTLYHATEIHIKSFGRRAPGVSDYKGRRM